MANPKGCFISGIFLMVIGAVLFILAFALLPSLITTATNNGVIQAVIVDSPSSTRYNDWTGQQSIDNYYQQYYYAWNLTNAEQVLKGEKAIYETVGPFNYKYEFEYSNVSFTDGGNLATYTQTKSYIYQEDMSPNDPSTVMITNFNPAYMGLMYQLSPNAAQISLLGHSPSAEDLLYAIGSCGQMKLFLDYLSSDNFTDIVYFIQNAILFETEYRTIVKSLNGNTEYFYQQWSNGTTIPSKGTNWNGMLVSQSNNGLPSNITMESAMLLFNSSNENSILNSKTGETIWINAMLNDKASISILNSELQLSESQITYVLNWWLGGFANQFTNAQLFKLCSISDLSLLGVCQFISAAPLNGRSIANVTYIAQQYNHGPIEIPLKVFSLSMSTQQAYNSLFNELNENSILNLNGMVAFITAVKSDNLADYNISILDAIKVVAYATVEISNTYTFDSIQQLYTPEGGSGLIVTRTMQEWLWTCNDPILNFLGVDQPCALQQNNTVNKPSTIFTGKDDLTMTNTLFEYQEQTVLTCWNGSVDVVGQTESGQFPPLQQSNVPTTMTLFEENVIRPVQLVLGGDSVTQGIDTKRYYLVNNSFPVSEVYKTSIPGFANLSDIQNLPIYVSLWDMYEVPAQYSTDIIQGLNQTYASASVPLDLEPITGNALYYNLKLQINLAIPQYSNWFSNSSIFGKLKPNSFYPSLKIGQTATPSDSTINLMKSQFKLIKTLTIAPVIVISIVGGIILIAGLAMTVFGLKKIKQLKQQGGYEAIVN